jgi:hypothetical protein
MNPTVHGSLPVATAARRSLRYAIATLGAGAVLLLVGGGILPAQQRPPRLVGGMPNDPAAGASLWISTSSLDDGRQVLLVVDPHSRNAAVYHLDGGPGTLTLRSTRNLTWDLLVPEYNGQEPKPGALKKMLEAGGETFPAGQTRP